MLGCGLALIVLAAGPLNGAQISGSVFSPSADSVDLSAEGSVDWAHWGYTNKDTFNHKSSGGSQISALGMFNEGANAPVTTRARLTDSHSVFKWNDGNPNGAITDGHYGVYTGNFDGPGRGFVFTVPADLLQRVLKVYVGEWNANGTLEASLSDSSAPMYTNTMSGVSGQTVQGVYTLNYSAASNGKTLQVRWKETGVLPGGADNVAIQAASLQVAFVPEPATLALLSSGIALLFMRRRTGR